MLGKEADLTEVLRCVSGAKLRSIMSSIIRWRKVEDPAGGEGRDTQRAWLCCSWEQQYPNQAFQDRLTHVDLLTRVHGRRPEIRIKQGRYERNSPRSGVSTTD